MPDAAFNLAASCSMGRDVPFGLPCPLPLACTPLPFEWRPLPLLLGRESVVPLLLALDLLSSSRNSSLRFLMTCEEKRISRVVSE